MKATDFNLSKDISFDFSQGLTIFHDSRLLIFSSDSIGLLRQNLIELLGFEKARTFFLKFGFQNGYSDFMQINLNYSFDTEMDLLASGPVLHTWEGIVQATPKSIDMDRANGKLNFTGVWSNSYEADQHLSYYHTESEPVCWSLMGYASGWCSAFMKKPMVAVEPVCVGKGDDHCEWKILPRDEWGPEAAPYIDAFNEFFERM